MAFIQPCFIKKNTPELRKKLEELGYNRYPRRMADWSDDDSRYVYLDVYLVTDALYYTYPQEPTKPKNGEHIDCGDNEELFLALAALRDDSDYMQWFTNGEKWIQNKQNDIEIIRYGVGNPINFHKATAEEIIEHFK